MQLQALTIFHIYMILCLSRNHQDCRNRLTRLQSIIVENLDNAPHFQVLGIEYERKVIVLFSLQLIDKPWLLSRFGVYCKLYHSLVTFHCLTPKRGGAELGSDSERSPNYDIIQYSQNRDNNMVNVWDCFFFLQKLYFYLFSISF